MKVLVSILTSSKPELLKLCYESICGQETPDFEYDIVVIVNTLNPDYAGVVRESLPAGVHIVETESNGRPGKGHNSVLRHFASSSTQYDYCVIIDGDDFLYPRAFRRLQHYLAYQPDVLFITFHDMMKSVLSEAEKSIPFVSIQNKCYLFYNITDVTLHEWYAVKGSKNPFTTSINDLNTLARPFVFSKAALVSSEVDLFYDESMKLFDDFVVFMKCFEQSRLGKLKVYGMVDADMYLYNMISTDNATNTYFDTSNPDAEKDRRREQECFMNSIQNKFLTLRRWDLSQFPLLELGQMNEPDNFVVKYKFVNDLVRRMSLPLSQVMDSAVDNLDLVQRYCEEHSTNHTLAVFLDELMLVKHERLHLAMSTDSFGIPK